MWFSKIIYHRKATHNLFPRIYACKKRACYIYETAPRARYYKNDSAQARFKKSTSWEGIDMHRLAASAAVALAWLTVATCQLSCNSQLRLLPAFAHLFTLCDCSYSEWTEWVPISSTPVPRSQCSSGRALTEERRQRVLSGENFDESREENVICKFCIMLYISACM